MHERLRGDDGRLLPLRGRRAPRERDRRRASFVLEGFAPEQLPVTTTLAQQFAVFDAWYAAFPGPPWPNHLFSITGTSAGCSDTGDMFNCTPKGPGGLLYPQPTIFESLQEAGHDWMMIYNDSRHE